MGGVGRFYKDVIIMLSYKVSYLSKETTYSIKISINNDENIHKKRSSRNPNCRKNFAVFYS